ncbi:MAG TPA: cation diffusion facilitator family transporter [Gemmatimonadaceae bacterium]|nr:cation diffusion facilitator family transporter [Gemmatimonadaceae bacterium]
MHQPGLVQADRSAAIRHTLALILVLNVIVVAVKLVVGIRTSNLTVIGATLESFLDAMNNVIAIVLVAVAAHGPDEGHPYGHDKFETMGAIAIVGFLSISCFELIRGGVARLLGANVTMGAGELPGVTEAVLLASTALVNVVVVWFERRRGRELASPLLLADAAHTAGDLLVTALAVASLIAVRVGVPWADPVLAIVVAMVIAWSGWRILRVTVPVLVDASGADPDIIRAAAVSVEGVRSAPHVRSRTNSSGLVFVDVTITVDGALPVAHAHELADAVEFAVSDMLGTADVTVHVEPVDATDGSAVTAARP